MKWGHFIFSAFACARRRAGAGSVLQSDWLTRTVREEPPKSTCALIASRCAAHHARDRKGFNRKPAPQPSHSVALTVCQRTRKGVSIGVGTALSCFRTKTSVRPLLFPAKHNEGIPRFQANGGRLEVWTVVRR